jgi:hypothetical protein
MNTRATTAFATAVSALALVAAGCGVGSTDEGEVSATSSTYMSALADGDYALACEQLTEAARPAGDCAAAVETSVEGVSREAIDDDVDGKMTIDVDGAEATVTLESGRTLRLARVAGSWLISSGYGG